MVFKAISTGGSMAGATVAVKQLYLQSVSTNIANTLQVFFCWEGGEGGVMTFVKNFFVILFLSFFSSLCVV